MSELTSTRGGDVGSFVDGLLRGMARDGGLYVPTAPPTIEWPDEIPAAPSFTESAAWAGPMIFDGLVDARTVREAVTSALDFPAPLVEVDPGVHVLELFHGPSLAFKDVGARMMARFMVELDAQGSGARTVLVATSGDTGGAVASAFSGMERCRVVVLFPERGVSDRQRRQMTTLENNVTAVAVDGTFDDCQRLAKEAFANQRLVRAHALTSANSINVGRLLPQTLYYLHAAASLERAPRFAVPCGNLGNLCAGLIAHVAGMPAAGFLAATNVNDAFAVFLESGEARAGAVVRTVSNAMDVSRPSNLERIRSLFRDDLDGLRRLVRARAIDDDATRACIRDVYERTGYVLDPHAAVAYRAQQLVGYDDGPTVVLGTAHPAKFPEVVEEAIGVPVPTPRVLESQAELPERSVRAAPSLHALEDILNRTST